MVSVTSGDWGRKPAERREEKDFCGGDSGLAMTQQPPFKACTKQLIGVSVQKNQSGGARARTGAPRRQPAGSQAHGRSWQRRRTAREAGGTHFPWPDSGGAHAPTPLGSPRTTAEPPPPHPPGRRALRCARSPASPGGQAESRRAGRLTGAQPRLPAAARHHVARPPVSPLLRYCFLLPASASSLLLPPHPLLSRHPAPSVPCYIYGCHWSAASTHHPLPLEPTNKTLACYSKIYPCSSQTLAASGKMKLVGGQRRQRGFGKALKEQRARLYIIQRCVVMLLRWHD